MATPHRTKQVNLRFPLPLLSQIKAQADAQQQAIADWIVAVVRRELEPKSELSANTGDQASPFSLHPELIAYIESCIAPLREQIEEKIPDHFQSEISQLRLQLGESRA